MATLAETADKSFWVKKEVFHGVAAIMKEIQMFPQITEETEENLLNLDQQTQDSKCSPSPPSSKSSSSLFESVVESPPPAKEENHITGPIPKIVTENVDNCKSKAINRKDEKTGNEVAEYRPRMRSLSGGAYRFSPVLTNTGRTRRQSGDDVLTAMSPSRRTANAFLDAFRPRSKSDSKGKRPTLLTTLKNSIFSNNTNQQHRKYSLEQEPFAPVPNGRQRSRSGSDAKSGPMSKMMDMFRARSNSISLDQRNKKPASSSSIGALMRRYSVDPDRRRHHPLLGAQRSLELPSDSQLSNRLYHELRSQTEDTELLHRFFAFNTCHDVIPYSVKVIILDSYLEVEKAFVSLMTNRVQAAPIWDRCKMNYIGMLTITDLIDVLTAYYTQPEEFKEVDLTHLRIIDWRNITNKENCFTTIYPSKSLYTAIERLVEEKVHRLPLYDPSTQSVIGLITHKRILKYFVAYENLALHSEIELPWTNLFTQTVEQLKIGTYENIATVAMDTTVIEALEIFTERKVSSLPVIEENKVVKIFSKSDLLALTIDKMYEDRTITVGKTLDLGEGDCMPFTCLLTDTFQQVLMQMLVYGSRRIVVIHPDESIVGIISTSDVVRFLSLKAVGKEGSSATDLLEAKSKVESNIPQTEGASDANTGSCGELSALTEETNKPSSPELLPEGTSLQADAGDLIELESAMLALLVNPDTIQEENLDSIMESSEKETFRETP